MTKTQSIEKCRKLIALATGTSYVHEAETAFDIMKKIAVDNNLRINPETIARVENHIRVLRGEKVRPAQQPKTESTRKATRRSTRGSMAGFIRGLINEGWDNEYIIRKVESRFGQLKDNRYINWYRSQLRRDAR